MLPGHHHTNDSDHFSPGQQASRARHSLFYRLIIFQFLFHRCHHHRFAGRFRQWDVQLLFHFVWSIGPPVTSPSVYNRRNQRRISKAKDWYFLKPGKHWIHHLKRPGQISCLEQFETRLPCDNFVFLSSPFPYNPGHSCLNSLFLLTGTDRLEHLYFLSMTQQQQIHFPGWEWYSRKWTIRL